jgi:hypothetical protein
MRAALAWGHVLWTRDPICLTSEAAGFSAVTDARQPPFPDPKDLIRDQRIASKGNR